MLSAIALAAVARPVRRALVVLAAAALAACAHGGQATSASTGEVARTLEAPAEVARRIGGTFRPIGLDELAATSDVRTRLASATAARRAEVWQGTYEGRTYGQRGAISLVLRPESDGTLRGVVAWRVAPEERPGSSDPIALVRAVVLSSTQDAGQVVLALDSHFDPACHCTARATFRGAMRGDTLTGKFTVEGAATMVGEERGRWRAVRAVP